MRCVVQTKLQQSWVDNFCPNQTSQFLMHTFTPLLLSLVLTTAITTVLTTAITTSNYYHFYCLVKNNSKSSNATYVFEEIYRQHLCSTTSNTG